MKAKKVKLFSLAAVIIATSTLGVSTASAEVSYPDQLSLDYAYYSPQSLIIKNHGWLEEALENHDVKVNWVHSRGSNNSLEFLNSRATSFALTSSISAFISRANGQPVKTIYSYLWAEPSALMVTENSSITSIADIEGKTVAATKGTDPYFFLLRALEANQLEPGDINIVHLQHPDGKTALEQARVDVWAGLDPHMASAELAGNRFIYRNPEFGLGASLNTTESFLRDYPDVVTLVLKTYERARQWIIDNPGETAQLVADETQLPVEVIQLQLARYNFDSPIPDERFIAAIEPVIPLLQADGILRRNADVEDALDSLVDATLIDKLLEVESP
ncbi:MAG: aliphatic sulfonate ABC transporter substrate-binding protein [Halomonas sp.]|uniref:aliphatic sulfonate ABC transporter substrate-binding protein n=1 Tax=Halomonas sp. TaxID=1486246 RepID=UPI003F8DA930